MEKNTGAGVLGATTRIFITNEDVRTLLGCQKTHASKIIREVNEESKSKGLHAFPSGKANKYRFSEMYGIPMEVIDKVISD